MNLIQDSIFIAGSTLLAHPVSYLFHLNERTDSGDPSAKVLVDKRLVLTDCRLVSPERLAGWLDEILEARVPLVVLCPSMEHLAALRTKIGIMPLAPPAALLIEGRKNPSGAMSFDLRALNYTALPSDSNSTDWPTGLAQASDTPNRSDTPDHSDGCACLNPAALSGVFLDPVAAEIFKVQVEMAMDTTDAEVTDTPPTGLKYFKNTITHSFPFTYAIKASNGSGSADFAWTVWGFLNQDASGDSQVLVAEGTLNLAAGKLHENKSCNRGYVNSIFKGTLDAPSPLTAREFLAKTGSVTIPISYKSPIGGYLIWDYNGSVDNDVKDWDVKSISSGADLGAEWAMSSPFDGSDPIGTVKDAFTDWGHVKPMPGASTGSLGVNLIAAWSTSSLLSGDVAIPGFFGWRGAHIWATEDVIGLGYLKGHFSSLGIPAEPGFTVDFTKINPS